MLIGMTRGSGTAERGFRTHWDCVLAGIHADALDCLQSSVAIIADDAYGPGAHLALGSRLAFPSGGPVGAIGARQLLSRRMSEASELLGLRADGPGGPVSAPGLRRRLLSAGPLYVVADAYDLHWGPYAGHRHMSHSFLLEQAPGGYGVIDAYHNDTEWGHARPGVWELSAAELDQAVGAGVVVARLTPTGLPLTDADAMIARNANAARAALPGADAYLAAAASALASPDRLEQLVLDIWHLTRDRLLHAAWCGDHPRGARAAQQAARWQQLSAHSYLTLRRARRGTPPGATLIAQLTELLHEDIDLAAA